MYINTAGAAAKTKTAPVVAPDLTTLWIGYIGNFQRARRQELGKDYKQKYASKAKYQLNSQKRWKSTFCNTICSAWGSYTNEHDEHDEQTSVHLHEQRTNEQSPPIGWTNEH
jgi:hypothetical protein